MAVVDPALQNTSSLPPMPPALHRIGRWTVLALVVLMPLVFLPDTLLANAFDTPRRLLLMLGSGLLLALLLFSWTARGRVISRRHPLDVPVLLFALAAVITGCTSAYPWIPFWGPVWSKTGLQVLGPALLLYLGTKEFLRAQEDIARTLQAMILTGGLFAVIGLLEYLGVFNFHLSLSGHRLIGTMGNSLFAGTYLATLLPLSVGAILSTPHRPVRFLLAAAFAVMLPAVIFTLSRSAWAAALLALLLMLVMSRLPLRHSGAGIPRLRWIVLPLLAAAGIAALAWQIHRMDRSGQQTVEGRMESLTQLSADESALDRQVIMIGAWKSFLARPVQGWGVGVARYVLPQYKPAGGKRGFVQAEAHSVPLQIAVETGLIGLLPYLLLLGLLFVHAFRATCCRDNRAWLGLGLLGGVTAYVLCSLTGIDNAATLSLFYLLLGILAAMSAAERPAFTSPSVKSPGNRAAVQLARLAAPVILLATPAFVITQLFAAYYLQKGVTGIQHLYDVARSDRSATTAIGDGIAADINRSMALTIMPAARHGDTGSREVYDGDSLSLYALVELYRAESQVYPDALSMLTAHSLMRNAGIDALARFDRTAIQGDLIVEYMRFKDNRNLEYSELEEARRLMNRLLLLSPACSDTHLLNAQLLEAENKVNEAAREAEYTLQIDPTYDRARLFLAHLLTALAAEGWPEQAASAQRAGELFQLVLASKSAEPVSQTHLAEYALALFLQHAPQEAAHIARTLRASPDCGTLIGTIRQVARRQPDFVPDRNRFLQALATASP